MQMKKILVTVVSDQTIPNVLFLKEMQHNADGFLFISTQKMEDKQKTKSIIEACGFKDEVTSTLIVNQDSPFLVKQTLEEWLKMCSEETSFIVNLTGGNKTTSLVIHNLFSKQQSSFYYIPIGTNAIIQLNENFEETILPLKHRLDLHTYLKANGLYYNSPESLTFTKAQTFQIFQSYKAVSFNRELFPYKTVTNLLGFELPKENAPGTWFEEYIFYRSCDELKLNVSSVAYSVYIFSESEQPTNEMEFDLIFVLENELYVAECKVSLGKTPRKTALSTMHKLNALTSNFGLTTHLFLITLADMRLFNGRFSLDTIKKCKTLKINNLADLPQFSHKKFNLKHFFNSKINNENTY